MKEIYNTCSDTLEYDAFATHLEKGEFWYLITIVTRTIIIKTDFPIPSSTTPGFKRSHLKFSIVNLSMNVMTMSSVMLLSLASRGIASNVPSKFIGCN